MNYGGRKKTIRKERREAHKSDQEEFRKSVIITYLLLLIYEIIDISIINYEYMYRYACVKLNGHPSKREAGQQ